MKDAYEEQALKEALRSAKSMEKRSSVVKRTSKRIQTTINRKIPDHVHTVVTEAIRNMIELSLTSSKYIHHVDVDSSWSLKEREDHLKERLTQYKRTAALEGAGTGAGGFWLGVADFPLLLSIKMKFLFDIAQLYGFDVHRYEERMFIIHVFMLAFSSDHKRVETLGIIRNWETEREKWQELDWKSLQQEYRDTIDLVKLFQIIPGIGAVVGYFANGKLLEQLGETAQMSYRLRLLH
ncbi:EcsC family protein [Thalassobacillus sp. CUG 92003]|uniref:EcsC family protein n=1 Tax=Thalassobacillus sp. CUG 92003 TaxID=2736641 RepID=UPI0015E79818|nr:EcsC family protein [Thalassobacillus sp. CUG 92003]